MVLQARTHLLVVLLVLSFFPLSSQAQFSISAPQTLNPSQLVVSPQYPEPGQTVRVSLNDYSINTSGARITWLIDGVERTAARDVRSLEFTAGALGVASSVTARTTLPSGTVLSASATVKPVRIDLLVEADTLTPSFFSGRALPSSGSQVRVTAIPFTGTAKTPESYAYRWTVGNTVAEGGSQFGKNSIVFTSQFERAMEVSVEVFGADGALVAKKGTSVPIVDPELHFYTINPLSGESEIAMGKNFIFSGEEMQVRAEPYYVNRTLMSQNPFIEWQVNRSAVDNPNQDKQEITLRKQGTSGSFKLEFQVRNLENLLQGVKDGVTISF